MTVSLNYLLRESDEIFSGDSQVGNPSDVSSIFHRVELGVAWDISENFSLRGTLPWITASQRENGLADNEFSGLGDASVSLLWSPWSEGEAFSGLAFTVGFILPSGESREQPLAGEAVPSVFQAGTGAWQGKAGVSYFWEVGEWFLGASLDTAFALEESEQGFRPAETYYGSAFARRPVMKNLTIGLAVDLFHGERDELEGQAIERTGSTTLSLKPVLSWNLTDEFAAKASVSIPLWRRVNSTQLAAGPVWSLGMSYRF